MLKRLFGKVEETKEGEESIEEVRAQRDELSTLVAGISDAILAVDREGAPLFYNGQFAVLVGPERMNQGRSKLLEMIRDPDIVNAFRFTIEEGRIYQLKAVPILQKDKKKFYSLSVSPLRRPDRSVYGAVGMFHDVTELKLAEQMRIDFVANVSHELRTPLTAIKGYTDTLIADEKLGRPLETSFLEVISRNVDRLMLLIRDLLDLSTMDSSIDHLVKEKISTEELTTRIVSQMQQTFEGKQQSVTTTFNTGFVQADLKRLEQVLVNLLDNASKYSPAGGSIHVVWEADEEGEILLRIEDTGPGIPAEHHDRLFERFYRVDKGRQRETGGTGLGLAIVKHIMQRHGGAVWVQSDMGRGSRFTCQFPNDVTG
ncbi:MAG: PAS domain-containing protein [Bdellovibrionales bacterium]|nr:PAS domain-containing protein [Bdellovibrionales bacterium]